MATKTEIKRLFSKFAWANILFFHPAGIALTYFMFWISALGGGLAFTTILLTVNILAPLTTLICYLTYSSKLRQRLIWAKIPMYLFFVDIAVLIFGGLMLEAEIF